MAGDSFGLASCARALVAGLAVINAAGVYAQLVAAHVGQRGEATAAVEMPEATLAARIDLAAPGSGEARQAGNRTDGHEGQRNARAVLVKERKREAGTFGRPASRARHAGRQGPANRDGSRTD
jgi:hypothetical protein